MDKISSAIELQDELRKLLAYAGTKNPSRQVVVHDLKTLMTRLATNTNPLAGPPPTDEKIKTSLKAIKKLEGKGYFPRSYSGRGMYGASCVGVTLPRGDRSVSKMFGGCSYDSMGMDTIWYWRSLPWPPGRPNSRKPSDSEDD